MISIVVPAHNEAEMISEFLFRILSGANPHEFDIIVVCNGCCDATAEVARGFGSAVRCAELPIASKNAALNRGDQEASSFPRFYIDADVRIDAPTIRRVAAALENGDALVAAPRLRVDLEGSSALVQAYYRAWLGLPWVQQNMVGSGIYALSREGRARFDQFPELGTDDTWVSGHFDVSERLSVPETSFIVRGSRTLGDVLRRKARIHATNSLLPRSTRYAERSVLTPARDLIRLAFQNPRLLPETMLYGAVALAAKLMSIWSVRQGHVVWVRDRP